MSTCSSCLPLHRRIFAIAICLCTGFIGSAQEATIRGYYLDTWKYRPDKKDSFNFEYYRNGVPKMTEDEYGYMIDYYKDAEKKVPDYSVWVDKRTWNSSYEMDSMKYVYQYHNKNSTVPYGSVTLERLAFRQSGGCFIYTNELCGVWYQMITNRYQNDDHGNCIAQVSYTDRHHQRDTSYYHTIYTYNSRDSIEKMEYYQRDTLQSMTTYAYGPGYKKTETYYWDRTLRERKEEYSEGGQLLKEIIYHPRDNDTNTNIYTYDSRGRKLQMQTYLSSARADHELIRTRDYFYW